MRWYIMGLVLIFIITGCSTAKDSANLANLKPNNTTSEATANPETEQPAATQEPERKSDGKNVVVADLAQEVILLIKDKNVEDLSIFVHPDKGVRFSPYGHVDVKTDRVYTAKELSKALSDAATYNWGSFDGSGEPIDLTFEQYYDKFIYDKDFAKPTEIAYDTVIGKGNTLINYDEVYPNTKMVEYHFPQFDKQYDGMDWESLRLIFEEKDGAWYLVAVIHDQWTI
ncbi:MAG TPA: hypothetical protein VGE40_06940 [Bacilli bacterium]